jgi:hypothetical protein
MASGGSVAGPTTIDAISSPMWDGLGNLSREKARLYIAVAQGP